MDVIRRAVGEDKISYFGFSYGSELGATWATLFPDTVRAMVIDGAADPDADPVQSNLQQLRGFEGALDTFLAQCSEDEGCAFNNRGDAAGAFDTLMAQLDTTPIPSAPDRPAAQPRDGDGGRRPGDVPPVVLAGARPVAGAPPRTATAPACCSSSTCTTSARRTARGATSSRRSA